MKKYFLIIIFALTSVNASPFNISHEIIDKAETYLCHIKELKKNGLKGLDIQQDVNKIDELIDLIKKCSEPYAHIITEANSCIEVCNETLVILPNIIEQNKGLIEQNRGLIKQKEDLLNQNIGLINQNINLLTANKRFIINDKDLLNDVIELKIGYTETLQFNAEILEKTKKIIAHNSNKENPHKDLFDGQGQVLDPCEALKIFNSDKIIFEEKIVRFEDKIKFYESEIIRLEAESKIFERENVEFELENKCYEQDIAVYEQENKDYKKNNIEILDKINFFNKEIEQIQSVIKETREESLYLSEMLNNFEALKEILFDLKTRLDEFCDIGLSRATTIEALTALFSEDFFIT